jgi:hypothetical protein
MVNAAAGEKPSNSRGFWKSLGMISASGRGAAKFTLHDTLVSRRYHYRPERVPET